MKRFFTGVLACAMLFAAGCQDSPQDPSDNQGEQGENPGQSTAGEIQDGAAWLLFYNTWLPVSLVRDSQQQLVNERDEWYFDIFERLQDDAGPQSETEYAVRDMYRQSQQNPFDNPLSDSAWYERVPGGRLAVRGDWEPFPVSVRYEVYTIDAQPQQEAWRSYFEEKLGDFAATTPLVITDAWFFDVDGDGLEESFVNANNTADASGLSQNPPAFENTAIYAMSAYFKGTGEAVDMGTTIGNWVSTEPVGQQGSEQVYISYRVDENSPEDVEQYVAAYQLGASGKVVCCPIFSVGEFERPREIKIVLADLDGDSVPELVTMGYSSYEPFTVYRLGEDGMPQRQFGINTPA